MVFYNKRGMDVRKKFNLSMMVLVLIVIGLSVLVYLSATKSPFQEEEPAAQNQKPPNREPLPETDNKEQEGGAAAKKKTTEEEDDGVIATVTLETTRTPEEQIQHATEKRPDLQNNEALYTVRMRSGWSEQTHPQWHPDGSHLSPLVAWSHRLKDTVFKEGGTASEGTEIMAETGATETLAKEIRAYTAAGSILNSGIGKVFFTPGESETQVKAAKNAPYITVVSMIAPSPDWFITARNVILYENGKWLKRASAPAVLYDAGTDSGTTFTAEDKDTNPKQPIRKITNPPVIPIATFEFIRK